MRKFLFSLYKPIVNLLIARLEKENINFDEYISKQDTESRNQSLDNFKENESVTALVASARIASEGLTLTEANHVIFLNRWWTPSTNSQARDRVVRIGQEKRFLFITYTSQTL